MAEQDERLALHDQSANIAAAALAIRGPALTLTTNGNHPLGLRSAT